MWARSARECPSADLQGWASQSSAPECPKPRGWREHRGIHRLDTGVAEAGEREDGRCQVGRQSHFPNVFVHAFDQTLDVRLIVHVPDMTRPYDETALSEKASASRFGHPPHHLRHGA